MLIELDSWQGKKVESLKTDNFWGCTVRCLQMLLSNALLHSDVELPEKLVKIVSSKEIDERQKRIIDILTLFDNDRRAGVAPFSI